MDRIRIDPSILFRIQKILRADTAFHKKMLEILLKWSDPSSISMSIVTEVLQVLRSKEFTLHQKSYQGDNSSGATVTQVAFLFLFHFPSEIPFFHYIMLKTKQKWMGYILQAPPPKKIKKNNNGSRLLGQYLRFYI